MWKSRKKRLDIREWCLQKAAHQGDGRVEQSPLQGGQDGSAWVQDLDEGGLEQLVAIEGHIPEEPGQGAASQPVPVVVPQHLLLTHGDLRAMHTASQVLLPSQLHLCIFNLHDFTSKSSSISLIT